MYCIIVCDFIVQVHGAHVLEKLHKASASGITFVKHAIQKWVIEDSNLLTNVASLIT